MPKVAITSSAQRSDNLKKLSTYPSLITHLTKTLRLGLLAAQQAVEYQRVVTYWNIGQQLTQYSLMTEGKVVLNKDLYRRVGDDLYRATGVRFTQDILWRMIRFYKNYPTVPKQSSLNFTHYLALMRIGDKKERAKVERLVVKEHMSALELKQYVTTLKRTGDDQKKSINKLICERGEPYVYRIRQGDDIAGEKKFSIDAGFKIQVPLKGRIQEKVITGQTHDSRCIRMVKEDGAYRAVLYSKGYAKLYTYAAYVQRVIDGDTLDVVIDVGFDIGLTDRIRLRGINAPEISSTAGRTARDALVKKFKQNPVMVIRTSKEGMYGRWLADVFWLPDERDPRIIAESGIYLNQWLLDQGLAKIYT